MILIETGDPLIRPTIQINTTSHLPNQTHPRLIELYLTLPRSSLKMPSKCVITVPETESSELHAFQSFMADRASSSDDNESSKSDETLSCLSSNEELQKADLKTPERNVSSISDSPSPSPSAAADPSAGNITPSPPTKESDNSRKLQGQATLKGFFMQGAQRQCKTPTVQLIMRQDSTNKEPIALKEPNLCLVQKNPAPNKSNEETTKVKNQKKLVFNVEIVPENPPAEHKRKVSKSESTTNDTSNKSTGQLYLENDNNMQEKESKGSDGKENIDEEYAHLWQLYSRRQLEMIDRTRTGSIEESLDVDAANLLGNIENVDWNSATFPDTLVGSLALLVQGRSVHLVLLKGFLRSRKI